MASRAEDSEVLGGYDDRRDGSSNIDPNTVVISGVSTVMPDSHNIMEFADNLYAKVNFVKRGTRRWQSTRYPELVQHHGAIPAVDRFDAQFFMVFHHLSHIMDCNTRKMLEHSYHAIFDAGISPTELSGRPIGVFASSGLFESEKGCIFTDYYLGIIGCNRAMAANRISYYLNLKGPSMLVDGEGAGSAVALEKAHMAIMTGQCEAAIVAGAKLLLHPQTSLNYHKQIPLNQDGNVKSYDMNADGHSFSEGVNVIFLQKYKDAKRVYAAIRHVKTSFSAPLDPREHQTYGPYRDPAILSKFLREFYEQAKVSPSRVEYVEGFGAGIPEADKGELQVIDEIFSKDRNNPLPVGSVMSNVGYTDAVSCLTSITKLLLGYHRGMLAANINYTNPRMDIPAIAEGRIKIQTEHEKFGRGLAAVNNFSVTGINAHVLLEGIYKPKNLSQFHTNLPYLVMVSGRQESAVQKILDAIKNHDLDPEEIALLRNIHRLRIPKHLARGFGIYSTNEDNSTETLKEEVDYYDDARRPLWFVYSGMGSQWAGMGAQLMRVPVFAEAIQRCHKALEPKGIDLIKVLTDKDQGIYDNILNSFIGIAAVQIALTDVLRVIGLVPDNIIGHSVGELGCAYGDGCLTAEEMILMAYSRGLVSIQTPFIRGSMAAVGIGFKQIQSILPLEIEVACHNGPESSTISGPADKMKQFVAELSKKGIFAKEVPCSNIAYHSRYIAEAGPALLKYLKEVVSSPKARSERWLSTSVPQDKWNEPLAKYSSAEYHTNNLLSPVLFEETLRLVPSNAVLVEIAPHGLLQAILKRSLPADCRHIPLTKRGHPDSALFLLEAIGKLYMEGYDIDVSPLYPKIEYPVSTETRSLSHLVEWMYSEKLKVCQYVYAERKGNAVYNPIISLYDEEFNYLSGNVIDGKTVFPFAGALMLVWETLAMVQGKPREQVTVQFKDVHFHIQPSLSTETPLRLMVSVQRGSGRFEVTHERKLVATGNVTAIASFTDLPYIQDLASDDLNLTSDDIYKILYEKGYQYKGEFRRIRNANIALTQANIIWNNNWVTFIDAALQFNILRRDHRGISQPQYIKRLCIDVKQHTLDIASSKHKNNTIEAVFSEIHDTTRCGGLTIENAKFRDKSIILRQYPLLKEITFVPFNCEESDITTSLYVFLQIIAENLNKNELSVNYITNGKPLIFEGIKHLLKSAPEINLKIVPIKTKEVLHQKEGYLNPDVVFLDNVLHDKKVFEALYHAIPPNTFMIHLGDETETVYPTSIYHLICTRRTGMNIMELSKWRPIKSVPTTVALSVKDTFDLEHLKTMEMELTGQQHKLLILATYPPVCGLKELVKEWRSKAKNVYVVMINDKYMHEDDLDFPSNDLVFNVLDNGTWGGEYYVPFDENINNSVKNITLQIRQFGNLDSLQWIDKTDVTGHGIPVKVHYAGLNFYDAKRAIAEISLKNSADKEFGMDFSGISDRGDRVMGLIRNGAVTGRVLAQPELLWPVPKHWTLEDAATVPLPYCLAFYCLTIKATLYRGMNILVHGGAGALGQAVISICLANQCNVFTTVSGVHKKRLLRSIFPDLPDDHIGNSRDTSFKDLVLKATNGKGCDIIISSVSGELKQASLGCCAPSGIMLDTVVLHDQENFSYGMYNMTKSRSYSIIDFSSIFENNNLKEMRALQTLVSEGIARGYVRPLTRVTFSPQDAARAVRLLAASRHRGRVLLNLLQPALAVQSRMSCSPNSCHLILCDGNDFGLQLADRLINNGAKKLYIHHTQTTAYLEYKLLNWQNRGVKVHVSTNNLKKKDAIMHLLKDCNHLAPVEGIYIIKSGQCEPKWQRIISDLDLSSRDICTEIRYFAIIHDSEIGNVLSERVQCGFPSLSLRLPDLSKISMNEEFNEVKDQPYDKIDFQTALDVIEKALCSKKPVFLAYAQPVQRKTLLEEVNKILGIDINKEEDNKTMELIGTDPGRAREILNIIEEMFHIALNKEALLQMTVSELKTLQENQIKVKQELTGLKGFFTRIESDELLADCNFVLMRTLIYSSDVRENEFDSDLTHLCIVPGLEGNHQRFTTLCERLKIPAVVLQPGFDTADEDIEEMAERLIDTMKTKHVFHNQFYLLGYEFGILVALEMAAQMEKQGLIGTIYCLGGAPEDICKTIQEQCGNVTKENLQNQLVGHVYSLLAGTDSEELIEELKYTKDWDGKVELCIKMIHGKNPYTDGFIRDVLNIFYKRILMAREYKFKKQTLMSKIVLLKAKLPINSEVSSPQAANTHDLSTTLFHAAEDLRCAAIVNKYLEPKILNDFLNRNRCKTTPIEVSDEVVFDYLED